MPLSPKQNYLNFLNHKEIEWTPVEIVDCSYIGFGAVPGPIFEKGPIGGGLDGFGVNWICPPTGNGASVPDPKQHIMDIDNFLEWRDIVKIPDVNALDWDQIAAREFQFCQGYDPNVNALQYGCGTGIFERLAALMGFGDALIAMMEEPEEVKEIFDKITDYKIATAKKVKDYIKPDVFVNYDDICTQLAPFISHEQYEELIKPYHKKLYDAVRELEMIPLQHTCGKAESFVEDMIEIGAAGWTSAQPTNDLCGLLDKYGDRFCIIGGWDSAGAVSLPDASFEERIEGIHHCFDTYGRYDAFGMFCFVLINTTNPAEVGATLGPLLGECAKYSHMLGRSHRIK